MKYRKYKKHIIKTIGKNIHNIRIEQNLSIEELAQKCGFKYTKMKKIDKGFYHIFVLDIFYLADALNIKASDILKGV